MSLSSPAASKSSAQRDNLRKGRAADAEVMLAHSSWRKPCSTPRMRTLVRMNESSPSERLLIAGLACSSLVLAAGVVAITSRLGIAIASGVLTVAAVVAIAGFAHAKNRWSSGLWVLMAAALPLFFALYAAGLTILRSLGQTVAGVLLIVLAVLIAGGTAALSAQWRRQPPRLRRN
jgi:hypothetical protein